MRLAIGILVHIVDTHRSTLLHLPTFPGRLCLGVLRTAAGELLSTEEIAGRVIAAKGFDTGDAILREAIREQAGSIVKRLRRNGVIENVGAGRASKWKLTGS
jgi:chromosome condensin MukBEF MukE localization factor